MPLPTFNQVFSRGTSAGFNWQAEAVMNMFVSALSERSYDLSALGPFTASGATGYNLQSTTLWSGSSTHGFILSMQQFIVGYTGTGGISGFHSVGQDEGWLKPIDLTGITTLSMTPTPYGAGGWYTGLDLYQVWIFDNCKDASASYTFEGADGTFGSGKGFTAEYPKKFTSLASSTYPDLLSVVVGDYARYTANGLVYHCTAITAGVPTWVRAPTHLEDRRKASEGGFRPYAGSFVSAPYGLMMHGDYGPPSNPALLNQLRDAIKMVRTHAGPLSGIGSGTAWTADGANNIMDSGFISLSPGTSAAAKAAADAAYAASGSSVDTAPFAWSKVDTGAGDATAQITRGKAKAVASTDNDGLTPNIEFYSWFVSGTADTTIFDANGDAISNVVYTKFDTQVAPGTGADVKSVFFGSLVEPDWAADNAGSLGYGLLSSVQGLAVFDYGVAGGFTYR